MISINSEKLYQSYAVLAGQQKILHFATGSLSQIAGRVRAVDKMVRGVKRDKTLYGRLPASDQALLDWAPNETNEDGWLPEIVAVPYPEDDITFAKLNAGYPGQLLLGGSYHWEQYGSEGCTLLELA